MSEASSGNGLKRLLPPDHREQFRRQAVKKGVDRWQRANRNGQPFAEELTDLVTTASADHTHGGVLQPMPRRAPFTMSDVASISPRTMRVSAPFSASLWLCLGRLFIWLSGAARFMGGNFWDRLNGRDNIQRRAVRLHKTFARIGGTFVKFGQQVAVRVDLVPYAYSEELSKLLDKVAPFPTAQAIAAVERVTGKPLSHTFATFDPVPIGSASVACVYQAVLHNGDRVAVKVRRPGIGDLFAADFRVLGWLFRLVEALTIVRPGFTENVLEEVRDTLMEELDFYKEARFQEIFRRRAKKAKRANFSSPRVYPQFCGEDVIVEEFVSGIWLSELVTAVERHDRPVLERIKALNIDPKKVARQLLWVSYWGLWESPFFHADPHPANIVVQRNGKLMFIDFGSMGSLKSMRRMTLHEIYNLEKQEDLETMSRLGLTLLEPLPPIDTERVIKEIQTVFWDGLIATRSKHSEWWERTSAQLWLGFFRVTSKFQIPMGFDTVRMIRATLLYDTLAARLDHDIDLGAEYRKYVEDAGFQARGRLAEGARLRLEKGLTGRDYLRLEQLLKMGEQAFYQGNRLLNLRSFNFSADVGKFVSAVILTITLAFQLFAVTAVLTLAASALHELTGGGTLPLNDALDLITGKRWYQLLMLILTFISMRRVLFRLGDKDV